METLDRLRSRTLERLVRSYPGTLKELGPLGSGTLLERDLP
jgi:hypothetical protein